MWQLWAVQSYAQHAAGRPKVAALIHPSIGRKIFWAFYRSDIYEWKYGLINSLWKPKDSIWENKGKHQEKVDQADILEVDDMTFLEGCLF